MNQLTLFQVDKKAPRAGVKWQAPATGKPTPCNAHCYYAQCGTCDCACGGSNHGQGYSNQRAALRRMQSA